MQRMVRLLIEAHLTIVQRLRSCLNLRIVWRVTDQLIPACLTTFRALIFEQHQKLIRAATKSPLIALPGNLGEAIRD